MRHAVQLGRHWSRPKVRGSYLLVLQLLPPSVKPLAGNCATLHCWRFCRSHTAIGSGILWESSAPQRLRDTFTLATLQPRSFRSRHYTQNSEGVARKHKGDTDGSKASFKSSSAAQISKIFGPAISPPVGNRLLRTIQQQRLDGKLDEASVEKDADALMIAQALFWLRQNYPMDEDAAMIRRVEREERELEEKYLAEIKKAENWRPQDRAEEEGIYGRSTFEELRKEKEERLAEERRTREADRHVRDKSLIQRAPHRAILDRRKASADWVKKYKERAQILDVWDPENVSTVRRMLPSAAFAAMFVGACYLFAQSYMPADSHHRLLPNITPSMATVGTIMAINIAIYAAWKYPPFWRIGNKYFLVVAAYPKPTSLLGSTFSHQQFHHLAGNMIFLWLVGPKLHDQVGRGDFICLYLSCGVLASVVSLSRGVLLLRNYTQTQLGASGAVLGVAAAWLALNPESKFTLWILPDDMSPSIPSGYVLAFLVLLELYGLAKGVVFIDHFAHLGGLFAGLAGALVIRKQSSLNSSRKKDEVEAR